MNFISRLIFLLLYLISNSVMLFSQDIIIKHNGDEINSRIHEITDDYIKYYEYDFQDGPIRNIDVLDVFIIIYENCTRELFTPIIFEEDLSSENNDLEDVISFDPNLIKISRENPNQLTVKGSRVFIEIPNSASLAGERYFIDALHEWGYWNIVDSIVHADFVLEFNIDKKAMLAKSAYAIFKTVEVEEFKKTNTYTNQTTAFNGYNAFKGVAKKLVKKYFKKHFK